MKRELLTVAIAAMMFTLSIVADAQSRPGSPRNSAAQHPSTMQQRDSTMMRQQAEMRRQEAEARRQTAEAQRLEAERRKAEAEAKRAEGEAHNRSEEARAEHPPNEHAAIEAIIAEGNADNQEVRDERSDLRGESRGEHGEGNPETEK